LAPLFRLNQYISCRGLLFSLMPKPFEMNKYYYADKTVKNI